MPKPLAVDLFCGLYQSELRWSAYASINQFVACRAENPDHVPLRIGYQPPSSISFELRSVCDFEDAIFATRFTSSWDCGDSPFETIQGCILEVTFCFINCAAFRVFSARPYPSQFACRANRARRAAVSLVAIWWFDFEVGATGGAIDPIFCCAFMFISANAPSSLSAIIAAPFPIGSARLELGAALPTRQIIHTRTIT